MRKATYVAVSYPLKLTFENDRMIDVMCSINPQISRTELINELIKQGINYFKKKDDATGVSFLQPGRWLKVD